MPINPNVPIQSKGGVEANVQAHQAKVRELMVTTDSNNLYVGKGTGNNPVLVADSTVPDRVTKLENQTNTLFATDYDDFDNSSKIATNSGLVVSDGKIRPALTKYNENFINDTNINLPLSSDDITTNNGVAEVYQGTVGYIASQASNQTNSDFLFTQPFDFFNATKIKVTANATFGTGLTGIETPRTYFQIDNTNQNEHLFDMLEDSNGGAFFMTTVNVTSTAVPVLRVTKNGGDYVQWNFPHPIELNSDTAPTMIKNVSMTQDNTYVYVALTSNTGHIRISRIHKTTLVKDATDIFLNEVNLAGRSYWIDIEVMGGRLHALWTNRDNTNGYSRLRYAYKDLSTAWDANFSIPSTEWIGTGAGSTDVIYAVKLCPGIGNQLGWTAFARKTTVAVISGIIDVTSTTSNYQFRTVSSGSSGWAYYPNTFTITFAASCNGMGTMIFDQSNSTFYIIFATNGNTDIRAARMPAGQTGVGVLHAAITTPAEYSTVSNRSISALIENTSNVHIAFGNGARTALHYVKASFASNTFTAVITNNTTILANQTAGMIQGVKLFRTQASPFRFILWYKYQNELDYVQLRDNILPDINVAPMNANASTYLANFQNIGTTGSSRTFTISANSKVSLAWDFYYPIYSNWWSGSNYAPKLASYTIEQTEPLNVPSGIGSGEFNSNTLINDRIIKEVTLSATQNVGTNPNNSIQWFVRAKSGGQWLPINNNETLTIAEASWGSSLQVRAELTYGDDITDITTAPSIDRYEVNVKNTVTENDLLPMQINMLKMGLRLQALTNYTTTSFTKMMIDTFLDQTNIDTANTTATYGSTNQWYTTASQTAPFPKVVTGKVETTTGDGVDTVTSAIFMAEHQGPFAPTYYMRRGTGSWQQVQLGTIINFTSGSPSNQIQWKADLPENCYLLGVAYLYN